MKTYFATLLLLTLIACSTPVIQEDWRVEYRVSGGITGKMQGLILSANGQYTVFDKRRNIEKQLVATEQQLNTISKHVTKLIENERSELSNRVVRTRKHCADCITSQLILHHHSKNRPISVAHSPAYGVILGILSKMLLQGLASSTGQSTQE